MFNQVWSSFDYNWCHMPHLLRISPARREDRAKFGIWTKVGRDKEVWALNWERGGFWNLGAGSEMVPNATNQVARYLDTIISIPRSSPSVIWAVRITYNLSSSCSKIIVLSVVILLLLSIMRAVVDRSHVSNDMWRVVNMIIGVSCQVA